MNRRRWLWLVLALPVALAAEECTTAVISGQAVADGRPILWKNRDTDQLSNKVVYVDDKPYRYVGVVNAADNSGRVVWGGVNGAGFAIINSVAYNLPQRQGERIDLEGMVMADALRTCGTVDEFETFLKRNLGPSLGSRANYCATDARGGAAIFETHNHGFKRLNASEYTGHYLLNTNWSRSGTEDKGNGYIRFDRETAIFDVVPNGAITPQFVLQMVARDLGHPLVRHPSRTEWKRLPADKPYWIHSNFTIDRLSTASSILIQGVKPGEDPRRATLWVILGEPVCSIATPYWVEAGEAPAEAHDGEEAPLTAEAARLKGRLRPLKGRDRAEYLDVTRLDNQAGTGWLPGNLKVESEIFAATRKLMEGSPSAAELAAFQKAMAAKALARLREVR